MGIRPRSRSGGNEVAGQFCSICTSQCLSYRLLNANRVFASFTWFGKLFHIFTVLTEKKFCRISRLEFFRSRLNGESVNLVLAPSLLLRVNQVASSTLSCLCRIFQTWIMSPLFLLSNKVIIFSSFNCSWYEVEVKPDVILTTLFWMSSKIKIITILAKRRVKFLLCIY